MVLSANVLEARIVLKAHDTIVPVDVTAVLRR